jgi:hypothetical protein
MKYNACMAVLAVMLVATALPAAEPGKGDENAPTPEQLAQYERGLALKAREAELEHQQNLRALELEGRRIEIERQRRSFSTHRNGGRGAVLLLVLVINILVTIWVCKDMREQKIGRALWVPIVLLAGILGAILYAIVRVADTRPKPAESAD